MKALNLKLCAAGLAVVFLLAVGMAWAGEAPAKAKPSPQQALSLLKEGNQRFMQGRMIHPHQDAARLKQAGSESQGDHAYATVLSCADSRVPVEEIFDAGLMDIFVARVAGNIVSPAMAGTIEYGLAHVHTPVLVIMGHTKCGAVAATLGLAQGKAGAVERNIPVLLEPIIPAVQAAMAKNPQAPGPELLEAAVEQNVWLAMEELFLVSPAIRNLVKEGKVAVVGAVYHVGDGQVHWLDEAKPGRILADAEKNPNRAMNPMAD